MAAPGVIADDAALWGLLWDNAQSGLAIVSPDGRWVAVNRTLCAFLEYSEAELRRLTWMDVTDPGDLDADREMADGLARHPIGGYDMHKRYICKSRRIVWASLRVVPIVGADGRFAGYLSQISPVVPVAAPLEERRARHTWRWVRDYWAQIIVVLGSLAVIAAQVIEKLGGRHD